MWYFDLKLPMQILFGKKMLLETFRKTYLDVFISKIHEQFIFFFLKKETATKKTGPSVAAEGIYFSYLETSSTSLGQTAMYESSMLVIRK